MINSRVPQFAASDKHFKQGMDVYALKLWNLRNTIYYQGMLLCCQWGTKPAFRRTFHCFHFPVLGFVFSINYFLILVPWGNTIEEAIIEQRANNTLEAIIVFGLRKSICQGMKVDYRRIPGVSIKPEILRNLWNRFPVHQKEAFFASGRRDVALYWYVLMISPALTQKYL